MRERVEERGLSRVRVTHQRDHAQRHGLPRTAARGSLAANGFDRFFNFPHAIANPPPVGFEFLFARSARPDAAAQPRKLFAASGQAAAANNSVAPAPPATGLRACARASRKYPGSTACGQSRASRFPSPYCAAARASNCDPQSPAAHGAARLRCEFRRVCRGPRASRDQAPRAPAEAAGDFRAGRFGKFVSSSSESRPAAVGSPARPRGDFFRPTPTSKTLSRLSSDCAVFMRMDWPWPRANCGKFYSLVIQLYAECARTSVANFSPRSQRGRRAEAARIKSERNWLEAAAGNLEL